MWLRHASPCVEDLRTHRRGPSGFLKSMSSRTWRNSQLSWTTWRRPFMALWGPGNISYTLTLTSGRLHNLVDLLQLVYILRARGPVSLSVCFTFLLYMGCMVPSLCFFSDCCPFVLHIFLPPPPLSIPCLLYLTLGVLHHSVFDFPYVYWQFSPPLLSPLAARMSCFPAHYSVFIVCSCNIWSLWIFIQGLYCHHHICHNGFLS